MVTIAVASYNNSKYITRCIDSCLNQTYKNVEILVIDDGSSDDTKDLLKKRYKSTNIHMVFKENGGLSSSRQEALQLAKGDFICFVDADDYLNEDYISQLYKTIVRDKSDVCVCNSAFYLENGDFVSPPDIYKGYKETKPIKIDSSSLGKSYIKIARLYSMCDSWNKMYRVSFLKKEGICFKLTKGFNGSDLLFNHKILMHNPVISECQYTGYNHIIYTNSATSRKNKKMQEGNEEIWYSLFLESKSVMLDKALFGELSILYFCLLRDAYQDGLVSNGYKISFLKAMIKQSKIYEKKYQIGKTRLTFSGDFKLKIFYTIRHCPLLLLQYLKARGKRI